MQGPLERLTASLDGLYPGRGNAMLEALLVSLRRNLPERFADRPVDPGQANAWFSSEGSLLITYADMLRGGSGSPLATLADFAERRLGSLISHIHILPFFPSSSDEGFSVMDYRAVNPSFGSWGEIARIGRNFGLAFDLVLNHASVRGEWFRQFLEGREPYSRFFVTRPQDYDGSRVFRPRTHPLLSRFVRRDGRPIWVWTTFSSDQADLDYSNPEVFLEIADVFLAYLARGARIVRLDAVAYAWKEDGTACVDLPKVHTLVRLLRSLIELAGTGAVILSETNLPHEVNISYFGSGDEAHLVYNFALPPLVLHAFLRGRADYLAGWAATLPEPMRGRGFINFLASHDGIGLTPIRGILPEEEIRYVVDETKARGGLVSARSSPEGPVPYELDCTFLDAVADPSAPIAERVRIMLACHAVMFSLAGIPAVYFHGLVGSGNWKDGPRIGGSDRSINRERLEAGELERELDDPSTLRHAVFSGLGRLLRERLRRRAFSPSVVQHILVPDGSGDLLGEIRPGFRVPEGAVFGLIRGDGPNSVLALVNVSSEPSTCNFARGFHSTGGFASQDGTEPIIDAGDIQLPPWGWIWIDGTYEGG